ncbi:hypothetical protein K9L67_01945, partial [Candidatus Woesearchaeota archaeon]|nr:hypothetical protein [Candidatus Woesearchaeota archaeon]
NQKTNITNETILPEKNKKYSCTTTIKTKDNTIQKTSETYIFQENTKLNLDTEKTKTTTLQKITGNVINLKNIEKTQTWQYTSLTISIILITLLVIILRKKHKN